MEQSRFHRLMFSMAEANQDGNQQFGQISDFQGEGNAFVFEDWNLSGSSDRDYNDIILSIRGAEAEDVPLLDELLPEDGDDWRETPVGEEILDYITDYGPEGDEPIVTYGDRFLNPSDPLEILGRVDPSEDITHIEVVLRDKFDQDWQSLGIITTWDAEGRFALEHPSLDPGQYVYQTIAQYESGLQVVVSTDEVTVLALGESGIEYSDRAKLALEQSTDLGRHSPEALARTQDWIVSIPDAQAAEALATEFGVVSAEATGLVGNTYRWELPLGQNLSDWLAWAEAQSALEYVYPLVPFELSFYGPADEPSVNAPEPAPQQWHLTQSRVTEVWNSAALGLNVIGTGVNVAVVDAGFDLTHPDLNNTNWRNELGETFNQNFDTEPELSAGTVTDQLKFKSLPITNVWPNLSLSEPTCDVNDYTAPDYSECTEQWDAYNDHWNQSGLNFYPFRLGDRFSTDPKDLKISFSLDHANAENLEVWLLALNNEGQPLEDKRLQITSDADLPALLDSLNTEAWNWRGQRAWALGLVDPDVRQGGSGILRDLTVTTTYESRHGTNVAGIVAAEGGRDSQSSGVAPGASWAAFQVGVDGTDDAELTHSLTYEFQAVDIYQSSWGMGFYGRPYSENLINNPGSYARWEQDLPVAIEDGRDGKGNIYVFAAGNHNPDPVFGVEDRVDYNAFANNRHTIAVGAVDYQNRSPGYSNPGAALFVSAYSSDDLGNKGITTTDLDGTVTNRFGGTSAAAPFVSGVIALMLEANPYLTWRDVQHILAKTAQRDELLQPVADDSEGWTTPQGKHGVQHHHYYGFGLIDPVKAVQIAKAWEPLNPEIQTRGEIQDIPNIVNKEITGGGAESTWRFKVNDKLDIESLELHIDATNVNPNQLDIVLESPSGIRSVFSQPFDRPMGGLQDHNWTYTSLRHWGELSTAEDGIWTVRIINHSEPAEEEQEAPNGALDNLSLKFYGTDATDPNKIPELNIPDPTLTYIEDTPLSINTITVADGDSEDNLLVTLTLSDPEAGELRLEHEGTVLTSNDQGILQIPAGAAGVVNAMLANLVFVPTADGFADVSIEALVDDGKIDSDVHGLINLIGTPVNDAPRLSDGLLEGLVVNDRATISYQDLIDATGATDVEEHPITFKISNLASGTLYDKQGYSTPEITLIPGEAFRWQPSEIGDVVPALEIIAIDQPEAPVQPQKSEPITISAQVDGVTISLELDEPEAYENGDVGVVKIKRKGGDKSQPLMVEYVLSGTAANGEDFDLPGTFTFRANRSSGSIEIEAIDDSAYEGVEIVNIQLAPGPGYQFDPDADPVTIKIWDSETPPPPSEGEFQVNTHTPSAQRDPAIAALNDGSYLVTWNSNAQETGGYGYGVYGQRLDAGGNKIGDEFQINSTIDNHQIFSDVVGLADGGYVVTWSSPDGNNYGISSQRYDQYNQPVGEEQRVNESRYGYQDLSSVTATSDGGYVVAWQSNDPNSDDFDIYARKYDAEGNAGSEFPINATIAGYQSAPVLNALEDGSFVATWVSEGQDGSGYGIYSRRFAADGTAISEDEMLVNQTTAGSQFSPTVTTLEDGSYVVAWHAQGADGSSYGIVARQFGADGQPLGDEFSVNSTIKDHQAKPAITALANGGFAVTWQSYKQDGSGYGVYGQRFDAQGQPVGDEFQAHAPESTYGQQRQPVIAGSKLDESFMVVWQNDTAVAAMNAESEGADKSASGVFAQRFENEPEPAGENATPELSKVHFDRGSYSHTGNTNPEDEGWRGAIAEINKDSVHAFDDDGTKVWKIRDKSTINGSGASYNKVVSDLDAAQARLYGWSTKANFRIGTDDDHPGGSIFNSYRDGFASYTIHWGSTPEGETMVRLITDKGIENHTLIGVDASEYHDYELRFDPATEMVSVWVDGAPARVKIDDVEQDLVYKGNTLSSRLLTNNHTGRQVYWGSGSSGDTGVGYWQSVDFEIHKPEPTQYQPHTISYEELLAASNATDADGSTISFVIEGITDGQLTQNGEPVVPGETVLSPGAELVWTPETAGEQVTGFTVRATDGELAAADVVAVTFDVAAPQATFLTPDTPYLSREDSPFKDVAFSQFHLEDFEDGALNNPGVNISSGYVIDPNNNPAVDSVDADDSAVDGIGLQGTSWYAPGARELIVSFDAQELGELPTHAGLAMTDISRIDSTGQLVGDVQFEAFDSNGQSLGTTTIEDFGDNNASGRTDEDRFLGVQYDQGISSIKITLPDGNPGLEIDHIQYGIAGDPPANVNWTWTYSGADSNPNGNNAPLTATPNADAARAQFLANLQNVQTQSFEGFTDGEKPTTLTFGNETATLSGAKTVRDFSTGAYDGDGTYPNSGDKYLFHHGVLRSHQDSEGIYSFSSEDEIKIEFTNPQSAFGFTTSDLGDGSSQLVVTLHRADGSTEDLLVSNNATPNDNFGKANFFGVTNIDQPFTAVTIASTNHRYDGVGIDDLIIGEIKPEVLANPPAPPNTSLQLVYREDQPLDLSNILVREPGNATVTLTLSNPNAGILTTDTVDGVTASYDAASGIWTATGDADAINQLLSEVTFNPAPNATPTVNITTEVSTSNHTPATGTIELTGIPEPSFDWTWTYFGEDLHTQGNEVRLTNRPNSDSARADFLNNLENTATVNFDDLTPGEQATTLDFGDVKATLTGFNHIHSQPTETNGGMFPTSGDQFLGSYDDDRLKISFDSPQTAFGFTATDAEGTPITLILHHTDGTTNELNIPVQGVWPANTGSALFYGITEIDSPFDAVTLTRPNGNERIGLDDLVIGTVKPEAQNRTEATPPNSALHLAYHEGQPLNLTDIQVTAPSSHAQVFLQLSDTAAGALSTGTSGAVTSIYEPDTGLWKAEGNVAHVNALLAEVEFVPSEGYVGDVTIHTSVISSSSEALTGQIQLRGVEG